jgi:hypothetical protein
VEVEIFQMDKYQEQPQLLDPHLESIVSPLMKLIRASFEKKSFLNVLCKMIYILTKVRGYKTVGMSVKFIDTPERFFPHEASDLERTLQLLQQQNPNEFEFWETRYVLFLWFSLIVLIPFDLKTIDSEVTSQVL